MLEVITYIAGFSFGAAAASPSSPGGGITPKPRTSAQTCSAKWSRGIPKTTRNPAVIADNVGDNVGDGGMGATSSSYSGSIIACATSVWPSRARCRIKNLIGLATLPAFLVAAVGIIASLIGTFLVKTQDMGHAARSTQDPAHAVYGASGLVLVLAAISRSLSALASSSGSSSRSACWRATDLLLHRILRRALVQAHARHCSGFETALPPSSSRVYRSA